jgi:hypothetical protein
MVVDMGFFVVVALFVGLAVVVAVCERAVVMRVRVPVGAMIPLRDRPATVVVRDMVVVVAVGLRGMRVRGLSALTLSALGCHVDCLPLTQRQVHALPLAQPWQQ